MNFGPYSLLILAAIVVSICFWARLARRDDRLIWIYLAALVGAFAGAKLVYFLAEGWLDLAQPNFWQRLATGKTIIGGLLGGYAGVEIAKYMLHYRTVTGDWFALIAPVGILLGRIGCLLHGCCQGVPWEHSWFTLQDVRGTDRWPAVPVEIGFNIICILLLVVLRQKCFWPGQHFHLYLIGYGCFRFAHEFVRAEPRLIGPFTGYHLAALVVLALGLGGFFARRRKLQRCNGAEGRRDALPYVAAGFDP